MAEDYKATIAMTCTNNNNLKYGDTFYCLAKYQLIWQYTYVMVIRSVLIFLNLVSYYKDIYHDKATAFFCEYLLKCAFPCDLLGMWICYIYLWYTNARQTAKLLWCFLDSVLKAECGIRIKTNEHHHWCYIIESNESWRWLSSFFWPFRIVYYNIRLSTFCVC